MKREGSDMGEMVRYVLARLIGRRLAAEVFGSAPDSAGSRGPGLKLDLGPDDEDGVGDAERRAEAAGLMTVLIAEAHVRMTLLVRGEALAHGEYPCRSCGRDAVSLGGRIVTATGGGRTLRGVKVRTFVVCGECLDGGDGRWRVENWAARDVGAWPDRADVRYAEL